MKYYLLGGGHVEATTPLELVEALRQEAMAWVPSVSIEDYMEGVQHRWKLQSGANIRTDSVENFVADLLATDFMEAEIA